MISSLPIRHAILVTIHNLSRFTDSLWDWGCLDGCFGSSAAALTDVDGLLERHGHFLMVEAKGPRARLPLGQRIMFSRLAAPRSFEVLVVNGDPGHPETLQVLRDGDWGPARPCDLAGLRAAVADWWRRAEADGRPLPWVAA